MNSVGAGDRNTFLVSWQNLSKQAIMQKLQDKELHDWRSDNLFVGIAEKAFVEELLRHKLWLRETVRVKVTKMKLSDLFIKGSHGFTSNDFN